MTTKPPLGLYWLASYPKSGNTWIRCILEHYFLGRLEVNRLALVKSDQNNSVRSRIPLPGELPPHIQKIVRPAACVGHMVHWDYKLGPCIVKTHYQWRKSVASITAGSVYLIRDPRDIACSLSRHLDCPIDRAIATMGDKGMVWENHGNLSEVGSWSDHVRGWADRADSLIKYEDLRSPYSPLVRRLGSGSYAARRARPASLKGTLTSPSSALQRLAAGKRF
jgi:aryl sulfotransferase